MEPAHKTPTKNSGPRIPVGCNFRSTDVLLLRSLL
jgi:hypothetical protein